MQTDLEILKETKYLSFIVKEHKPKTKVVAIVNKTHKDEIGVIRWYSPWRQYCFFPHLHTIWNTACLDDVNDMIIELKPKPRIKNIAVIAATIQDFINWKHSKRHGDRSPDTVRVYQHGKSRYVCLTNPTHCCGYGFDKIIETEDAYLNKDYHKIMKSIHMNVKK